MQFLNYSTSETTKSSQLIWLNNAFPFIPNGALLGGTPLWRQFWDFGHFSHAVQPSAVQLNLWFRTLQATAMEISNKAIPWDRMMGQQAGSQREREWTWTKHHGVRRLLSLPKWRGKLHHTIWSWWAGRLCVWILWHSYRHQQYA